ncbi:MAG: zf-HC2 domain-containing protein [Acidobacteriota bacterium]|nr:zf-HC2 domain-containing protein [Acidobacteriota bacterium]
MINTKQIRSYLLGTLTEGQKDLEERLMTDDDFLELLQAEEEELIQDYADGELSPEEVTAFETHFLISDERRQKVEFARGFRKQINLEVSPKDLVNPEPDEPKLEPAARESVGLFGWLLNPIAVGAIVILLFASLYFVFIVGWDQETPLEQQYAKLNRSDFTDLSGYEKYTKVELISGVSRANENVREIDVRQMGESLLFRLGLPGQVKNGELFNVRVVQNDKTLFSLNKIASISNPVGSEVRLLLPSAVFDRGLYEIRVKGSDNREFVYALFTK